MANEPKPAQISQKTADNVSAMSREELLEALQLVMQRPQQSDPALLALAEGLAATTKQQARLHRPSNVVAPGISEFSYPEGETERPKAKLSNETYFEGVRQSEEQLTPMEIDLFNSITISKDARKGAWKANLVPGVGTAKGRLQIWLGIRQHDDLIGLPPLVQILMELSKGADATDVAKLFEQLEAMKAQIQTLEASRAAQQSAPAGVTA